MNLQQTMSKLAHRELTLEEAKDFCNNQFGMVNTYLIEQWRENKAVIVWQIEDVQSLEGGEKLTDAQALEVIKAFEKHHDGSMESMWEDLKYHLENWKDEQTK